MRTNRCWTGPGKIRCCRVRQPAAGGHSVIAAGNPLSTTPRRHRPDLSRATQVDHGRFRFVDAFAMAALASPAVRKDPELGRIAIPGLLSCGRPGHRRAPSALAGRDVRCPLSGCLFWAVANAAGTARGRGPQASGDGNDRTRGPRSRYISGLSGEWRSPSRCRESIMRMANVTSNCVALLRDYKDMTGRKMPPAPWLGPGRRVVARS